MGHDPDDSEATRQLIEEGMQDPEIMKLVDATYAAEYPQQRAEVLQQRAILANQMDDFPVALAAFRQMEVVGRERNDETLVATARSNQALILGRMGKVRESTRLFDESAETERRLQDVDRLVVNLRAHVDMLMDNQGDMDKALLLLDELKRVHGSRGELDQIVQALNSEAVIYHHRKDHVSELRTLDAMIDSLRANLLDADAQQRARKELADLVQKEKKTEDVTTSRAIIFKTLEISRAANLVQLLRRKTMALRESDAAPETVLPVFDEVIKRSRQTGDAYTGAVATSEKAIVLSAGLSRHTEALALLKEAGIVFRRLDKTDEMKKCDQIVRAIEQAMAPPEPERSQALPTQVESVLQPLREFLDLGTVKSVSGMELTITLGRLQTQERHSREQGNLEAMAAAVAAQSAILAANANRAEEAAVLALEAQRLIV